MAEVAATIVREGWLQKRSQHIGDWRDRYFILFDNGDLLGFRTQPDRGHYRNPLNEFTVRDCQIMAMDRPRPYSFTIRGTQVSTNAAIERNFSVHTEREREEWIAAIRYVSRLLTVTETGDHPGTSKQMETDNDGDMEVDPVSDSRRATLENYEIIKVLGRGAYGKVVLSREKTTGRLYATKIVKKQYISQMGEVHHAHSENRVLKKAKHPFLTALRYSFQTDDCICFVMEYANGGELFFHLRRERCFSEERTRFYGAEIVSALGYLHSEGIIYRDLKLENLLLDKDGHIKIADFGLCKLNIMYGNTTRTFCGTPEYQAPEVIKKHEYGPAVDWWGTGVVMYEMMCGRLPFYNRDRDQLSTLIVKHEVRFPPILSAPCRSLLAGLLTKEPELRLGAGPDDALEIMRHPFFASINWTHLVAKKIPAPFKPQVSSDMDTKYFDPEFTGQSVALTPPERGIVMEEGFSQFSYQDIISSEQSMRSRSLD